MILGGLLVAALSCTRDSSEGREGALRVISDEVGPLFLDNATEIEHDFSVRNLSGTEPMKLEVAKRACSCFIVAVPPGPVPPGATRHVKLAVSIPCRTGINNAAVQLKTGLSDHRDLLLRLSIPTYRRISVEPPVLRLSELRPGSQEVISFDVLLRQPLDEAELPVHVEGLGKRLSVEVVGTTQEQQDQARVISVRCRATIHCPSFEDPDCPAGPMEEQIRIRHGEHSTTQAIRWSLRQVIVAEPKQLFFQCASRQNPEKVVHLRASQPFRIGSIATDPSFIQVRGEAPGSQADHELTVRVCGAGTADIPRAARGMIRFRVDHPEQKSVMLPIYVLWVDAARSNVLHGSSLSEPTEAQR
jgi:hypothetical protein